MTQASIFDGMTNLYSLSKTLRFELKPVGKTLENMKKNLEYDESLQTFLKDQRIEDAYQTLKPEIDKLHEEFITLSLGSDVAKQIDFSTYLELYKDKKNNADNIEKEEKKLRGEVGKTYDIGANIFKHMYNNFAVKKWKKGSNEAKGSDIMQTEDILSIIRNKNKDNDKDGSAIIQALGVFKGFYTYLSGYNQNRANYYEVKDEKSTAVATRVVHVNLAKFCDNVIVFETHKDEYMSMYQKLQALEKILQIKDKNTGNPIPLEQINERYFSILFFNDCLTQIGVENYNRIIGHYNVLVNLYNQNLTDKSSKRLERFKLLYKQIGCGGKKVFIKSITHDTREDIRQDKKSVVNAISLEETLEQIRDGGKKLFTYSVDKEKPTVPGFIQRLKDQENWKGIYWSKKAIDIISNLYFSDWMTLKDLMKGDKTLASFDKKREEQIKINDAVELYGLFGVIDSSVKDDWKETFFKQSILDNEENKKIIDVSATPSQALLQLIFKNIGKNIDYFINGKYEFPIKDEKGVKQGIEVILIRDISKYKEEKNIEAIKAWMDTALAVLQAVRYFKVNESKVKGEPIKTELVEYLGVLLGDHNESDSDMSLFSFYDLLRNYLTKKEEDEAQANKLKLNFESGSLLGGRSDGQEKVKKSVLLKKNDHYYLGILKKNSLFDTEYESNPIYQKSGDAGRLILANLKFQTLAGKGFLGEFGESYGKMGTMDPQRAIFSLQKIILDRYVKKYPLLKMVATGNYTDKKVFDKDINDALKECYVCEFTPINWDLIEQYVEQGDLYMFKISDKDLNKERNAKPNLQVLYWDAVFNDIDRFQLNGGAEVFFRKTGIKEKKTKKGYEGKPRIIEGKRFTENNSLSSNAKSDKDGKSFFFHCPIKLNYKGSDPKYSYGLVNKKTHENISTQENLYFLGLDRGEKHLIYYSIVDSQGNNIDQGSFNVINGKDYHKLLSEREGERMEARKNWQKINNIAKLKEGYISIVVHEIAKKLLERPGYIVLEDLNTGFKQGRQRIEKSIYQKFELALAKKLNFLVDKNVEKGKLGSTTNALQLTPYLQNYSDIENKKQFGIMLYTRANYTSQTDPATGWRKTIYMKKGSEKEKILELSDIGFDGQDYYFKYADKVGNDRVLWSGKNGEDLLRYRGKRTKEKNIRETEQVVIRSQLDLLFEGFDKKNSLLVQLKNGKEMQKVDQKRSSWESLAAIIDIIQQIRNLGGENNPKDDNFLLSPVRDKNGNHFDSRKGIEGLPKDADANGAYNIARKGVIMNAHIKQWVSDGSKKDDLDLFVSEEERDLWLTNRGKRESLLPIFSSRKAMEEKRKKQ